MPDPNQGASPMEGGGIGGGKAVPIPSSIPPEFANAPMNQTLLEAKKAAVRDPSYYLDCLNDATTQAEAHSNGALSNDSSAHPADGDLDGGADSDAKMEDGMNSKAPSKDARKNGCRGESKKCLISQLPSTVNKQGGNVGLACSELANRFHVSPEFVQHLWKENCQSFGAQQTTTTTAFMSHHGLSSQGLIQHGQPIFSSMHPSPRKKRKADEQRIDALEEKSKALEQEVQAFRKKHKADEQRIDALEQEVQAMKERFAALEAALERHLLGCNLDGSFTV